MELQLWPSKPRIWAPSRQFSGDVTVPTAQDLGGLRSPSGQFRALVAGAARPGPTDLFRCGGGTSTKPTTRILLGGNGVGSFNPPLDLCVRRAAIPCSRHLPLRRGKSPWGKPPPRGPREGTWAVRSGRSRRRSPRHCLPSRGRRALRPSDGLREFAVFSRNWRDSRARPSALDEALDQVGLGADARKQALSGYSKRHAPEGGHIALAVLRDAPALLLDEPTSGLDPSAIDEFHGLVRSLADQGKAVLMVTHDVYGACQVVDRIGLLRDGGLVGTFSSEEGGIATEKVHRAFTDGAGL